MTALNDRTDNAVLPNGLNLDDARRHLTAAERSARHWEGTAWQASLLEARAHLARVEGDEAAAATGLREAADLFAAFGQPLDEQRCRS